jgi:lipopolysaccharide export system permease protein
MKLIDRYIALAVALGVFSVLLSLLVLMGFFELLAELEDVTPAYTTTTAFAYVGLILPRYTYDLFPIATLLGSLIGLGALASHSELTAMRAAGISIGHIIGSVLKAGLGLLLLVLLIGEYLAPLSEQQAQRLKMAALSDQATLKTGYEIWSRSGDTYINAREVLPDGRLGDVSIFEFDPQRRLRQATHAAMASFQGDSWLLQGVKQSRFSDAGIQVLEYTRLDRPKLLTLTVLDVLSVKPHMLPAWDLWRYVVFLKRNGQDAATYEVAFWSKLVAPLVTLVMLFLSIPFVFGPLRSVGIGQRIFTGALIGIVFYLLNRAFSYLALVYGIHPLFAALFPTLVFFAGGIGFFRRIH